MKKHYLAKYRTHHKEYCSGHISLGLNKKGACTITIIGAAAMSQEELDFYGNFFAEKLKELEIPNFNEKKLVSS